MSGKTRSARKKLAVDADGPPKDKPAVECPIEANTAAMNRIAAFAKEGAEETEAKNSKMLAEHNTQIEEMDRRLIAVEKTQRWVEELAAELGVPMETVAAAVDGDGSAKKRFFVAVAAYQMEHETDPEAEDADDGEDADEDDEYDKATDAILRAMVRDNHAMTQQNAKNFKKSSNYALHVRVRRLEVMVCLLICAVVVMAVGYYRK